MDIAAKNTAPESPVFVETEILKCKVSFATLLDDDEVITGTPLVTEVTTSDLTITSKMANTEVVTIRRKLVAVGKAVMFTLTGQLLTRASYQLKLTVGTSYGQHRVKFVNFTVDDQ